jgi:hypothetical protein
MAYSATYNISIRAPQTSGFDYFAEITHFADVSRHGEWGMDEMKAAAEGPGAPGLGMRYKAEGLLMGKVNPSVVTITAFDAPKLLAF